MTVKVQMKKVMIAAVTAIAASLCFAAPALANNHADTGWSAYLSFWRTVDTPNRAKLDASYGYIYTQTVSGNRNIRAWMLGNGNEDVSSGVAYMSTNQARKVSNYVYERFGYGKGCHFRIQQGANYAGTTTASGLWSPDSV